MIIGHLKHMPRTSKVQYQSKKIILKSQVHRWEEGIQPRAKRREHSVAREIWKPLVKRSGIHIISNPFCGTPISHANMFEFQKTTKRNKATNQHLMQGKEQPLQYPTSPQVCTMACILSICYLSLQVQAYSCQLCHL